MLSLTGIGVQAAPGGAPVLQGVDLVIAAGDIVGIVGPNGAGKTTLARVIAGIEVPTGGTITAPRPLRVGLVLQDPAAQLIAGTVAEDVAFGLECDRAEPAAIGPAVAAALARLGLMTAAWQDPRTLSGGEQQRVAVAGQLVRGPDLLVLDEPTAHLDAAAAGRVTELVVGLAAQGIGVVWVTQRLEELARCTRVVAVDAGAIVYDGAPAELLADPTACGQLGLGVPAAVRLAIGLRARGVDVPAGVLDVAGLAAALGGPG